MRALVAGCCNYIVTLLLWMVLIFTVRQELNALRNELEIQKWNSELAKQKQREEDIRRRQREEQQQIEQAHLYLRQQVLMSEYAYSRYLCMNLFVTVYLCVQLVWICSGSFPCLYRNSTVCSQGSSLVLLCFTMCADKTSQFL